MPETDPATTANDIPSDFETDIRSISTPEQPPQLPLATPGSEAEFNLLDRRVIVLWRIRRAIGLGIVSLIAAPVGSLSLLFYTGWMSASFLLLTLGAFFVWMVYFRPVRIYRGWGYRLNDRFMEIRQGLLYRTRRLIPLNRLQHVDLNRGPIERKLGLASLILYTAGTHAAVHVLPGLDTKEAERLRDQLLEFGGADGL